MSENTAENKVAIELSQEQLAKLEKLEQAEKREKKLNALFNDEHNGKAFKSAYEKGGVKELLEAKPEILDSDVALELAFKNGIDKVLSGANTGAETQSGTTETGQQGTVTPPQSATPPARPAGTPAGSQAVDKKIVWDKADIDEIAEKAKIPPEIAAEMKAFL